MDGNPNGTLVVGIAGMFDIASYGDLLLARIAESELRARLPRVDIRLLSPFGWEHPVPMDGGISVEPLGAPTPERRSELAGQLDALIIGGGELIHDRYLPLAHMYSVDEAALSARAPSRWFVEGVGAENESRCPTIWHGVGVPYELTDDMAASVRRSLAGRPYVSVRDGRSLDRLRAAGADGPVSVVPDSGFLVSRLFPQIVLERRRALHYLMSWLPVGDYLVVDGHRSLINQVGSLCAALEGALGRTDLTVVTLDASPAEGDTSFSDALRTRCALPVHALPANLVCEDIAAVIQGARAVVGGSLHTSITAMSFGVPTVILNLGNESTLTALAELTGPTCELVTELSQLPAAIGKALGSTIDAEWVRSFQSDLDAHFDLMGTVIERATSQDRSSDGSPPRRSRAVVAELMALRRAHSVRGQQLVAERSALMAAFEEQRATATTLRAGLATSTAEVTSLKQNLAEVGDHHRLAVQRIAELDQMLAEVSDEKTALFDRAEELADTARQREAELREQLLLTETALSDVHQTKTFRLMRLPRRAFGGFRR